jgi:hypothetical protein
MSGESAEGTCETCNGIGWVWLSAVEQTGTHWKRPGDASHAIVSKQVRFRCPCTCSRGDRWLAARWRGQGTVPGDGVHYPDR